MAKYAHKWVFIIPYYAINLSYAKSVKALQGAAK